MRGCDRFGMPCCGPFLGDVVTVPKTLVRYRVHGDNASYLLADTARFTKQVERAYQRHAYARDLRGGRSSRFWLRPLFGGEACSSSVSRSTGCEGVNRRFQRTGPGECSVTHSALFSRLGPKRPCID